MAAKKSTAVEKRKPNAGALAHFEEELAQQADVAAQGEQLQGQFLSVRAGKLKFGDQVIKGGEINVVILDHIFENAFYKGKFDADNPVPPVCFAFGRPPSGEKDMVPHMNALERQHETCPGCKQNVFGTADVGKGKACKNIRRLAVIPSDDLTEDNASRMSFAFLKVPVTSVRGWSSYVNGLKNIYRRPPSAVITKIKVEPDEDKQVSVSFEYVEPLAESLYRALASQRADAVKSIDRPYEASSDTGAKPRGKAKKESAAAEKKIKAKVGGRR